MRDSEFTRFFSTILHHETQQNLTYFRPMKPETTVRLNAIWKALRNTSADIDYQPDATNNCIHLVLLDYVFDSFEYNLRLLLNLSDGFTIDALTDGKVCLVITLADAFEPKPYDYLDQEEDIEGGK